MGKFGNQGKTLLRLELRNQIFSQHEGQVRDRVERQMETELWHHFMGYIAPIVREQVVNDLNRNE